ncbi:hypothetical protein F5883DRAFT_656663 [Diaporthe sp. PMI_573]|nr:hypothetical protein F5883DRAFT_656663 [Diaporthaceae sp. PMI_573]
MSSEPEHVFIFYNDLTDSHNWAAAKVLLEAARKFPTLRIIWIIEPRHVAFGLYTTPEQQTKCVKLLEEKLLAEKSKGFKTLLNGLIEDDLQQFKGTAEMDLLKLAVRPGEGPKEDAELHGRFMALRFGNFLAELDPLLEVLQVPLNCRDDRAVKQGDEATKGGHALG